MIKKILLLCILSTHIFSQDNSIKGTILGDDSEALIGSSVYWINTQIGTTTDENGFFSISKDGIKDKRLITTYIGYKSDTIQVNNQRLLIINMISNNSLKEIELSENRQDIYIDPLKAIKTETISRKELEKAACCDLAGCFETQASVETKTTNVLTNTKELSILGLSGVYNQILVDGLPNVVALGFVHGVSSIPGTLIDNIHISQGLASTQQGFESITGQISIDLKKPSLTEKLFTNIYYNSFSDKQANVDYSFKLGNWNSIIGLHSTQPANKIDRNNDNFLDLPLTTKYSLYNKWIYGLENNTNLYSSTSIRFLSENKVGGQLDFDKNIHLGGNEFYGQVVDYNQLEINTKNSYQLNEKNVILAQAFFTLQDQEAIYGTTQYLVNQSQFYLSLDNHFTWNEHTLKSGISLRKLDIKEEVTLQDNLLNGLTYNRTYGGEYNKNELIPGMYLENNFNWRSNAVQLITGLRVDHHNEFGILITPRSLFKYNFTENTTARICFGSGWRTVNLFSEYIQILSSNREIQIEENLNPEKAINFGANFLHSISRENLDIQIIIDLYKTSFSNQICPEYFVNSNYIYVNNFEGKSISNSFQTDLTFEIYKKYKLKLAYNYLDVFRMEHGHKHQFPFYSKHHALTTFSYQPADKDWHFDTRLHWFGKKKILNTTDYVDPHEAHTNPKSEPFTTISGQITKEFNDFEIYFGCENILNFRQENPLINPENPFSFDFDIANTWGPTKGREFYIGFRHKI